MSYLLPVTLEEALQVLRRGNGVTRVIAGGTDLFPQGLPGKVADITAIPDTAVLEKAGEHLVVGSCITHSVAASSPLLLEKATALSEACLQVGSPQIRNMGTLGGNIVNAAPAADAAVALVALGGMARLAGIDGTRKEVPVETLYDGYNRSRVDSTREVLVDLVFRAGLPGEGSSFQRFASRKALSLPMLNAAVKLRLENNKIKEVRLVLAPVKAYPTRLSFVEELLRGREVGPELWEKAAATAGKEITVRRSALRCSEEYRRHLAGVLVKRALQEAALRAGEKGGAVLWKK